MKLWRILFVCATLVAIGPGCSNTANDVPELAPVTGTVTMGGKPLEGAQVTFTPQTGGLSGGTTDATGRFELYYKADLKGAVPGKHTIKISKMEGEAVKELVPAKYNEQSTLTEEVKKEGPNDFKFEL